MLPEFFQSLESRQLLAAGALDPTFGAGGATAIRVAPGGIIHSVNTLPDGKVLVATTFTGAFQMYRLNADGTADVTFGDGGRITQNFVPTGDTAIAPDGRIAFGGNGQIAVYLPDGSPDNRFGDMGVVSLSPLLPGARTVGATEVAFSSNNELIVAGPVKSSLPPTSNGDLIVMKFTVAGALDASFGEDGSKTILEERLDDVAASGDGHVLLATHNITTALNDSVEEPRLSVSVHRLTPNGDSDDPGSVGGVNGGLDFLNTRVKDLQTAPDGSVVALVYDIDPTQDHYVYSLRRYSSDGAVETSNVQLQVPPLWTALEANLSEGGQPVLTGVDAQGLWFAQRYTIAGFLDTSYGNLGVGSIPVAGPTGTTTGDATILDDGSVIIANTRERNEGTVHDIVLAKLEGGGSSPSITLSGRGTLITQGTIANDRIDLYIRSRDGRLMARSDDYVKSFAPSKVKRIAVFAGPGDDTITIGAGVRGSYAQGDEDNDTITGGDFTDIILGGSGDDVLSGGLATDRIVGNDGNDTIYGNGGKDFLLGSAGKDFIFGNGHDDTLDGSDGDDRLYGGGGADMIMGGFGADAAAYDAVDSVFGDVETVLT
jgi:uncharacterized delta-60 repeat protein